MKRILLWCGIGLGLGIMALADETQETEQELERLRGQIQALRATMEKDFTERDRLRSILREAEEQMVAIRGQIAKLQQAQATTQSRLERLGRDVDEQRAEVKKRSGLLAAQLKSAYMGGRQQALKLILNSEDPISLARVMTYYRFLSSHRTQEIQRFQEQISVLRELEAGVGATLAEQQRLQAENAEQLKELEVAREQRRQALAAINSRISDSDSEVQQLVQQEKALVDLLEELKTLLADYPVQTEQTFVSLKGQLQWPIPGQLLHDFGQSRAAKLPWQGVVVGAPAGTRVRAIARGRVSYADWLPGMGLLVILDHGGGFMSLYGYNQGLARSLGDWVSPGDTVALVGDTGGQTQSSLYFEIRQSGKPLNPHKWFKANIPKPDNGS